MSKNFVSKLMVVLWIAGLFVSACSTAPVATPELVATKVPVTKAEVLPTLTETATETPTPTEEPTPTITITPTATIALPTQVVEAPTTFTHNCTGNGVPSGTTILKVKVNNGKWVFLEEYSAKEGEWQIGGVAIFVHNAGPNYPQGIYIVGCKPDGPSIKDDILYVITPPWIWVSE